MTDIKRRGQLIRDDSNFPAGYNYLYLTATSGNVANKPGILHTITSSSATTIVCYDGTSSSGATIANIIFGTTVESAFLDVGFTTALYITNSTPGNITVSYISADK